MKIAAGEFVLAKEFLLKTVEVLTLTPEPGACNVGYMAHANLWHKGELDNYASIDIFNDAGAFKDAGNGPTDGSMWLNFIAKGE